MQKQRYILPIAIFFTVMALVLVSAATQTIHLNEGWNLISSPLEPTDTAIETILSPLTFPMIVYTTGEPLRMGWEWIFFHSEYLQFSTLAEIHGGICYVLQSPVEQDLIITGTPLTDTTTTIITNKWNYVGYKKTTPMSTKDVLSSLQPKEGERIILLKKARPYPTLGDWYWKGLIMDRVIEFGDFETIEPGEGFYMLYKTDWQQQTITWSY